MNNIKYRNHLKQLARIRKGMKSIHLLYMVFMIVIVFGAMMRLIG